MNQKLGKSLLKRYFTKDRNELSQITGKSCGERIYEEKLSSLEGYLSERTGQSEMGEQTEGRAKLSHGLMEALRSRKLTEWLQDTFLKKSSSAHVIVQKGRENL